MDMLDRWKNPNNDVVREYAKAFDVVFYKTENTLKDLFNTRATEEIVEKRIDMLDAEYHAGLKRNLGKHSAQEWDVLFKIICSYEGRIKEGDLEVVNELAKINDNRNCFVFATKYCSFVRPEYFPVYDRLVIKVLNWFQYKSGRRFYSEKFLHLEEKKLKYNYKGYKDIIDEYRGCYNISLSYKELDKFFWLVGKNHF